MRLKLDENLSPDLVALFHDAGHDASSIFDQRMRGAVDPEVARVCRAERRCLITLDLDFADITRCPPADYAGLVVLRLGKTGALQVESVCRRLLPLFARSSPAGQLWIVDEVHVRIRAS